MARYHVSAELDGVDLETMSDLLEREINNIKHFIRLRDAHCEYSVEANPIKTQAEQDWYSGHVKYLESLKDKIKIELIEDVGVSHVDEP